jgi:hypothetical protein
LKAAKENEYLQLTRTPRYFDPEHMPPLSLHQIFLFDECHKKTDIGRTCDTLYTFPLDEDGIYDAEGGIAEVDTKLHVKYAKEGRFNFGVAAVMLHDGTVGRRRCRTFDYSAKNLITITAEEKMKKDEIQWVRSLKTGGQWIVKRSRLPDVLFEKDCITAMTDIADTTKMKFARHSINTVLDMKIMTITEVAEIMNDKELRVS